MESPISYTVRIAASEDIKYIADITNELNYSATKRRTGIPHRNHEYIAKKIDDGLAVIAINSESKEWAGFCYIEVWQHQKYVANSGLIISPKYRGKGIARMIKIRLFELCKTRFYNARIFSLTANPAVIHVNSELGYKEVSPSGIIADKLFVEGCNSWVNYIKLMSSDGIDKPRTPYVAMVYDPLKDSRQ